MEGSQIPRPPNPQAPYNLPPNHTYTNNINASGVLNGQPDKALLRAQQEVDMLNHCFEEIELFMVKLQQAAEAQIILQQRNNKKKKTRKKEDDLLSVKAKIPPEAEFVQIFQKFKYSFCLLARLKSAIANPTSDELLHHMFKPLDMIVRTTGSPALAASVRSPGLTVGAVTLLKENLTLQEHTLWTSLGSYWTQSGSALGFSGSSYTPLFLNGWKPPGAELEGWIDPIQAEHNKDEEEEKSSVQAPALLIPDQNMQTEVDGAPQKERMYRCSYDFVARNSSELSVLQGDKLEVIESSKRWWKCRNRFNEVGFVPFNILEPVSHIESLEPKRPPKAPALPPMQKTSTLPLPSSLGMTSDLNSSRPHSIALPPQHLHEDTEKVMQVNDELLQRLTSGKAGLSRPLVIHRSADTSLPLDYKSPPAEVETWLRGKGFSEPTVQCLRVLTGAQLFSLNKEELRAVIPEEGSRVYSQLAVQKALLEDVRKATELETVMEKQKMKMDFTAETGTL
ncbi:epidermal growth factor receptor kinase substrate 8-like protein 1 [Tachysurus fulvidraco]|uniref:epidermal growth factor receptor kinase substrate 8-like protein 1 n=1 Tax=Tachysurus fulvidraco TaxID=1234273 RepID=UPI001FED59F3|nr:epidermal growth factor receptor kinase substrate 8-like protein 1 [Tachysurus fulvidraco]XP_027009976.2 epidermal growth factor receptor kinase substrate 8-like protein 1 [Tachysurus fulvidraco]